ncbi:MAG: phosphate signaling complex PhoU family protein [Acidimicrobiales bacterium]
MDEPRLRYHERLGVIEGNVIQLFALVAEGLVAATEALLSGESEVLEVLRERERSIDDLYRDVEALVNRQFALEAPVATDLRFLLSVLRVVPELERSHDLVLHIAGRAGGGFDAELSPRCRGLVERMGRLGSEMWRQAADSWYERDGSVAAALVERDDEMDSLHAALTAELSSGRMPLPVVMDMTLVARFYERLGDHAVNIARRVVYLAGSTSSTR